MARIARRPEGVFVNPFERGEIGPDLFHTAEARPRMSEVYACLGCSAQCGRCAHTIKRIMDERPGSVHANASMH